MFPCFIVVISTGELCGMFDDGGARQRTLRLLVLRLCQDVKVSQQGQAKHCMRSLQLCMCVWFACRICTQGM